MTSGHHELFADGLYSSLPGAKRTAWLWLIMLISLAPVQHLHAQIIADSARPKPLLSPLWHIEKAHTMFAADHLNNLYLVEGGSTLVKYDPAGQRLYAFDQVGDGPVADIDVSNPLKVLVFYDRFPTVKVLDNTLSPIGEFRLQLADMDGVTAIGGSEDHQLWIYDRNAFSLRKINQRLKVVLASDDLSLTGQILEPHTIRQRGNWVYMSDSLHGIAVFDRYATWFKLIPITGVKRIRVIDGSLYYRSRNQMMSFDLRTLEHREFLDLPVGAMQVTDCDIRAHRLYLSDGLRIMAYEISRP